jgi:predicted enzyme related to lactoylglutathione lyase
MEIAADAADTVKKAEAAGGKVIVAPMEVGDQGTMAFIAVPLMRCHRRMAAEQMTGAQSMGKANTYGWAELNARGADKAIPFYKKVFGWGEKKSEMAEGMDYTEFLAGGESIAGGMEMNSMVPAEVPS